ncbi:MAG: peptidoglycan-binding protein [Patescibacteria group bacterium]|mgnify:CR=1 FL=1
MLIIGKKTAKIILLFFAVLFLFAFGDSKAANLGNQSIFKVDPVFDVNERNQVTAELVANSGNLYFYVEKDWWNLQVPAKKTEILGNLEKVSFEFSSKIYPILTSVFGSEWKPGIDGDEKITILLEAMKEGVGGYFRNNDEYLKLQLPDSNEREMIYLALAKIDDAGLKLYLAHEFTHLITFNQKDRLGSVSEEVWLNEARAEYGLTVLGYNSQYDGSNLQRRIKDFTARPTDSVAEWLETKYDYASINAFGQYVMDHYGINIFSDSIKSKSVGITSINEALQKNGYKENFSEIFTNWTIAVAINNCSVDILYCYLNTNLQWLKINPELIFLPVSGESSLSVTNVTKNWAGNWQKIIGGKGNLNLKFSSIPGLDFKLPYIIFDKRNNFELKFLTINEKQEGEIKIENFGEEYVSLLLMPSLQSKISGFESQELTYPYTFNISISGQTENNDALIQKLLAQIEGLKKQISELMAKRTQAVLGQSTVNNSCLSITLNLSAGAAGGEVSCLQKFLKNQGYEIYPEGLVTGYFGSLTKSAVIRFQEKYKNEILSPLGFSSGTGFVGLATRNKINQLLNK